MSLNLTGLRFRPWRLLVGAIEPRRCNRQIALLHGVTCLTRPRAAVRYTPAMERADHVLVVDDDAEIRKLLGEYLERNGFRVSLATDGAEMRRALDRSRPDIVVLDLMLPGDDGLTLCRDLRAIEPAGDHAHRARRGDRPHRRPGDGRRRLPGQAVQPARAAGAHQEHPAPRARPAVPAARRARTSCASPAGRSTSPRASWSRPTAWSSR